METKRKFLQCACNKEFCLSHPGKPACSQDAVCIRDGKPVCVACKRNAYVGLYRMHQHNATQALKSRGTARARTFVKSKPTRQFRAR